MTSEELAQDILDAHNQHVNKRAVSMEAKVRLYEAHNIPFWNIWKRFIALLVVRLLDAISTAHEKEFQRLHNRTEKALNDKHTQQ